MLRALGSVSVSRTTAKIEPPVAAQSQLDEMQQVRDETLAAIDVKLDEMKQVRDATLAAQLAAFDGALTTDATGAAFASGTVYMDINTDIVYKKD